MTTDLTLLNHHGDDHSEEEEEEDVHDHNHEDHKVDDDDDDDEIIRPNEKKKPLSDKWRSWLILNLARGCARQDLYEKCVVDHGFDEEDVQEALDRHGKKVVEQDEEGKKDTEETNSTNGATTTTTRKAVNNGWKEWIRVSLDQGQTKEEVFLHCIGEGLNLDQVSQALGGYRARIHEEKDNKHKPAFSKRTSTPRAWKLDTDLVELYEIPNFLTPEECQEVIHAINSGILERSVVTDGNVTSRTSQTCHLRRRDDTSTDGIVGRVEDKLQKLMGDQCHPTSHAETLQGQCYGVGEYFQAHTDWFEPDSEHLLKGGQRTWTVMIYLNAVQEGGSTKFAHLERDFSPRQGWAMAWNNLDADNATPNPWTLHEAMPVVQGKKYVLTKWFRQRSMDT